MKVIVANPSVGPHVQQTVMAYYEAGYLDHFYTSFFEHHENTFSSFLKNFKPIEKEINRRSFHALPIEKFISRPFPELIRSIAARKLSPILTDRIWEWSELGFDKWVAGQLNKNIDVVHTYEHASLATIDKAKQLKIFCVYEQPSVHHTFFKRVAEEQLAQYSELKTEAIDLKVNHKADRRNKRRDKEMQLADMIVCNSTFTKNTLTAAGIAADKINVVPLAFPPVNNEIGEKHISGPIIFLHAGNQSLTKASHLLYEAWRDCNFNENEAELWLIGKMSFPSSFTKDLPGKVIIKENIPHTELMALYQKASVLVMPTLADGFGMVITEAMSQGLPVIASENCCGPDVIEHMRDGWIIPAGDVESIAGQLKWCINNRQQINLFGKAAIEKAGKWQWPQYRKKLTEVVHSKWQEFKKKSA